VEGKKTLGFDLTGRQGWGVGKVRLSVRGGGSVVNREFEVPVRPAWGAIARSSLRVLAPGETFSLGTDIAQGLMPDTVNARVTVSTMPPIPFAQVLENLLEYPYGCAEQTTTRGYAALLLDAETARQLGIAGLTPEVRQTAVDPINR
jgi:uncharacterized protein YfaS (alpha-2-macroglobulin family)